MQIEVEAPGYAFLELPPRELAAGENEAELRVPEALRLSLRLIDVRGTPVGGVGVGVDDGRGGLLSLQDALGRYDGAVATTDVAGRVDVFGVPRARVRIVVGAIGSGWRSEPPLRGTISPGVHAFELDLRTPPTGIVTLTVP